MSTQRRRHTLCTYAEQCGFRGVSRVGRCGCGHAEVWEVGTPRLDLRACWYVLCLSGLACGRTRITIGGSCVGRRVGAYLCEGPCRECCLLSNTRYRMLFEYRAACARDYSVPNQYAIDRRAESHRTGQRSRDTATVQSTDTRTLRSLSRLGPLPHRIRRPISLDIPIPCSMWARSQLGRVSRTTLDFARAPQVCYIIVQSVRTGDKREDKKACIGI